MHKSFTRILEQKTDNSIMESVDDQNTDWNLNKDSIEKEQCQQWSLSKLQIDTKNRGKQPPRHHERYLKYLKLSIGYSNINISLQQSDYIVDTETVVIPFSNPQNIRQRDLMLYPSVDKHLKRSILKGQIQKGSALFIDDAFSNNKKKQSCIFACVPEWGSHYDRQILCQTIENILEQSLISDLTQLHLPYLGVGDAPVYDISQLTISSICQSIDKHRPKKLKKIAIKIPDQYIFRTFMMSFRKKMIIQLRKLK